MLKSESESLDKKKKKTTTWNTIEAIPQPCKTNKMYQALLFFLFIYIEQPPLNIDREKETFCSIQPGN
jgi:hypothetical protein